MGDTSCTTFCSVLIYSNMVLMSGLTKMVPFFVVESKYLQAFSEFAPCRRRQMLLDGLQCHWLISLYRDLQKYPCFCGFEWCTLRIFFLSYAFLASLGSLEPIPFKKVNLKHIIHPLWVFIPTRGSFSLYPSLGHTYNLHPLLGRATACIHCWDVLQVLPITGTCYKL